MAELTGSEILAKCLKAEGVKDAFFIMGGPMLLAESSMINEGIRMIDVRHEQAAAFSAQAYSRLTQKPAVCMAASGPAAINLSTGLANALIDCCPVIGFGGASPISQFGRQVFQEIDQMAIMRGCVKYADRIHNVKRIPQQINFAFQKAMTGKPGPVYLDWPGDVLYQKVEESQVDWSYAGRPIVGARPYAEPKAINALVDAINRAERPIIASGGGVIWSQAWNEMRTFVEKAGIPFYTTPQGRGVVPDDHPYSYLTMRSTAFRDADLIIVLGTRMNYIIGHAAPPRFGANAKIARIEIDAEELGMSARNVDYPIVGDCKSRAAAADRRDPGEDRRPLRRLAQDARRRRGGEALRPRRQLPDRRRHPPDPAAGRSEELHEPRRDPRRRRPGDLEFRAPDDADLRAGPSAQFRPVRHDGRGAAVRGRRQGGEAEHPGDLLPRRRLVRPQRDGARHRGSAQNPDPRRHQPQRRLDRRPAEEQARPRPRLHPLRQDGRRAWGATANMSRSRKTSARALERAQKKVDEGMVALVNVKTDYRARAGTVQFSDYST